MKKTIRALAALSGLALFTQPASAITAGGDPDAGEHPYVGLMVANIGGAPQWRCSGALISPTMYVTAGHCTFGAETADIWF